MVDVFTEAKRSELMRRIRSKDTKPEMQVRAALHRMGLRYRLHDKRYPGKPDLLFPKHKAVVQVRGCFWHGHDCKIAHQPKSNTDYWGPKIARNKMRDSANDAALRTAGWKVFVIWECTCRNRRSFVEEIHKVALEIVAPEKWSL